jgi:hypothetical protein
MSGNTFCGNVTQNIVYIQAKCEAGNDAIDTIVAFVIPLVAMLTSTPVIWREERLSNFSVHAPKMSSSITPSPATISQRTYFYARTKHSAMRFSVPKDCIQWVSVLSILVDHEFILSH